MNNDDVTDVLGVPVKVGDYVLTNIYCQSKDKAVVKVHALRQSKLAHRRGIYVIVPTYSAVQTNGVFCMLNDPPYKSGVNIFRCSSDFIIITDQLRANKHHLPKGIL